MPFDLSLVEPQSVDYIYIDEHNKVHLLLPIVGGHSIGLDNTCQTAIELQKFWHGGKDSLSALKVLEDYQQKLDEDISFLEKTGTYKAAINLKTDRKIQIENYIDLLKGLEQQLACSRDVYPRLPGYVQELFKDSVRNCFTIHLCPYNKDWALRGMNPTFSLKRHEDRDRLDGLGAHLRAKIEAAFLGSNLSDTTSARDMLKAQVIQSFVGASLKELQAYTQAIILEKFGESVDLTIPKLGDKFYKDVNDDYLMATCAISFEDPIEEVLDALLNATLDDSFWDKQKKPLEIDKDLPDLHLKVEKAAMAVQFFLASINIYCYAKGLSKSNFGKVIEGLEKSNPKRFNEIVDNIASSFFSELPVDVLIFSEIDELQAELGLSKTLDEDDKRAIIKEFELNHKTIKDSPHLDEFILFREDVAGAFFNHKSRISIPWIDLVPESNDPRYRNLAANSKALKSRQLRQLVFNNAVFIPTMTDFLTSLSEDNYQTPTDFLCAQIKNPDDLLVKFSIDELSQLFNHSMWLRIETLMRQPGYNHGKAIDKAISVVLFSESFSHEEITAYSSMLHEKSESKFDPELEFFNRQEYIREQQRRLFSDIDDYHPMLHYLKAQWFSPSGIAVIQQFPETAYNYKTIQLLNTLNPDQFDPLSIAAIKNDGFPSLFDVQALQQRGRFILAIAKNPDKTELLKLHATWSSYSYNGERLAALLPQDINEVLSLEQLSGLKFYFQRKMSLQSVGLEHLQKLANLLQVLPILEKIDYLSVNDAIMRGIQEDKDVNALSQELMDCINSKQQPLLNQLEAAQSRYATHTSRMINMSLMWSDVRKANNKNRMIQTTLDEAKKLVANSEVTQALAEIRIVKKSIQDLFEGGAEKKWSWFRLKYIVPESGKVLNELITKLEEFQQQQTSSTHSP
ncbi:MAG: hypothetical protein EBY16_02020 [Gammaproteobacteria bacterium]|nr:hypothetical protein [Gammaproteobacteria bacterium]